MSDDPTIASPHADALRRWADVLTRVAWAGLTAPAQRELAGPSAWAAAGALSLPEDTATFADEFGHRRVIDAPFLACRRTWSEPWAQPSEPQSPRVAHAIRSHGEYTDLAAAVWNSLLCGLEPPPAIMAAVSDADTRDAPLTPGLREKPLEFWTETELACLHGLRHHARVLQRSDWLDRCWSAVRWHLDNLQPDNATNRPWAIHVFAEHSVRHQCAPARLHAEMMLHAACSTLGVPDILSRHILLDAAMSLELAAC